MKISKILKFATLMLFVTSAYSGTIIQTNNVIFSNRVDVSGTLQVAGPLGMCAQPVTNFSYLMSAGTDEAGGGGRMIIGKRQYVDGGFPYNIDIDSVGSAIFGYIGGQDTPQIVNSQGSIMVGRFMSANTVISNSNGSLFLGNVDLEGEWGPGQEGPEIFASDGSIIMGNWGGGRTFLGPNANGSLIMGVNVSPAAAGGVDGIMNGGCTNAAMGSILQYAWHGYVTNIHSAWIKSGADMSIGQGDVVITNPMSIVSGRGQTSHGSGTHTAEGGFWHGPTSMVSVINNIATSVSQAVVAPYTNGARLGATSWQNPSSATNWTWTSDGTQITLTGYTGPNDVVIPDMLDALPITAFSSSIFSPGGMGTAITSISGKNILEIDNEAFLSCVNLTTASFPNVTSVGNSAFNGCYALTSVSLPQALSIGIGSFSYCTSLGSITLPQVVSIDAQAFFACIDLTDVSLPKATAIGESTFLACFILRSVYFEQNAPALQSDVFFNTPNVTNYVSNPTATGWTNVWNGRPVVRMPVYGSSSNMTDCPSGAVATNDLKYLESVSAMTVTGIVASATNELRTNLQSQADAKYISTTTNGALNGYVVTRTNDSYALMPQMSSGSFSASNDYLRLEGGRMTGPLGMGNQPITNFSYIMSAGVEHDAGPMGGRMIIGRRQYADGGFPGNIDVASYGSAIFGYIGGLDTPQIVNSGGSAMFGRFKSENSVISNSVGCIMAGYVDFSGLWSLGDQGPEIGTTHGGMILGEWGGGRVFLGNEASGSMIIGQNVTVDGPASQMMGGCTNAAKGSILQYAWHLTNYTHTAWIKRGADMSIGQGDVVVSNPMCIVSGQGQTSHGSGTHTAENGFWHGSTNIDSKYLSLTATNQFAIDITNRTIQAVGGGTTFSASNDYLRLEGANGNSMMTGPLGMGGQPITNVSSMESLGGAWVFGAEGRMVRGIGLSLTNISADASGAHQSGYNGSVMTIGGYSYGSRQHGYNDSEAVAMQIDSDVIGAEQSGANWGTMTIGREASGAKQFGKNTGTMKIGVGSFGSMQAGDNQSTGVMEININVRAAEQRGYNTGIMVIGSSAQASQQLGYNSGEMMISNSAHGASQSGYNSGRMIIDTQACGAQQIGQNEGTATNNGRGSIQLLELASGQQAYIASNGTASIGMGACVVSNRNSIVSGDGMTSHGDSTHTAAGGFWHGTTNLDNKYVSSSRAITNYFPKFFRSATQEIEWIFIASQDYALTTVRGSCSNGPVSGDIVIRKTGTAWMSEIIVANPSINITTGGVIDTTWDIGTLSNNWQIGWWETNQANGTPYMLQIEAVGNQ